VAFSQSGHRERLADALYDLSKLLDRSNNLSENATRVVFNIGTSITTEPISFVINTHRSKLTELRDLAKDYSRDFDNFGDKWKYYATQISYVTGDNPHARIGAFSNAIGDYIAYFEEWIRSKT
jgi:hypothetical protein